MTITMTAANCSSLDTFLDLSGPFIEAPGQLVGLAESDDAGLGPCPTDSQIKSLLLDIDGTYVIMASSKGQQGGGHYRLELTCENNACAPPGTPTFASTRISQTDIDNGAFTPDDLFGIGDFLFETIYQVPDGMGNALTGLPANNQPRPNFRPFPNNVHFAAFGAPEAQSCVTCHNLGGDDGAGDLNHNIFQIGDGINRSSGVPRNPPPLLGSGLRQRIGEEMTAELQGQLAAGKAQAASTSTNVTVTLRSKNINFGSVVIRNTAPYLHDGRAPTLLDSILMHGDGEDKFSVDSFKALSADDQSKIVEFMLSLGRQENVDPPLVDFGLFQVKRMDNGDRAVIRGGGAFVPHGGFLIVARNASKAEFESFYGKKLDVNVAYVNAATDAFLKFPTITGGATFALLDPQNLIVDGPSIAIPSNTILSRTSCGAPAGAASSWIAKPNATANATPGLGPLNTGLDRICITEIADNSKSQFEYVEIFVE